MRGSSAWACAARPRGGLPTSIWRGDRYLEITVNNEVLAPSELLRSITVTQMAPDVAAGTITFAFWDGEAKDEVVHDFTAAGNVYHYRDLHVGGDLTVDEEKSAVVETENYGNRKLYAFEQSTNRFADEGVATLTNGSAKVTLDPIFLETVEDDFHIHLTPYGNASLYVAEIGADYFEVESQEEGATVDFAWLLTTTRTGYEDVRLESAPTEE